MERTSALVLLAAFSASLPTIHAQDPMPLWNDTAAKKVIMSFAEKVTKEGAPDFSPPNERIATFEHAFGSTEGRASELIDRETTNA